MNRRSALGLIGTAATMGTAGCLQVAGSEQRHKLWYVSIRNNVNQATIDLRVRRNDNIVYQDRHKLPGVESFEAHIHEPRFVAGLPHVRFQKATWDTAPANFALEYRPAEKTDWERESFSDIETTNIGVTVDIGSEKQSIGGLRIHEHESEAKAQNIIDYVEQEREDYLRNRSQSSWDGHSHNHSTNVSRTI